MRQHLLIAGTGRAGTSLLVRILDACGLETEISRRKGAVVWDDNANAGMETVPIVGDNHPYVVKSAWSAEFLNELLQRPGIKLDAVIIPIRDITEAAASRVIVELRHGYKNTQGLPSQIDDTWHYAARVRGGVTYSLEPLDQARILAFSLHRIIEAVCEHDIPIHFLMFPRFASDPEYLFKQIRTTLPADLTYSGFKEKIATIIDLENVNIGRELEEEQRISVSEFASSNASELPAFETLDRIALKRELRSLAASIKKTADERDALRTQLKTATAELAEAHDQLRATIYSLVDSETNKEIALLTEKLEAMQRSTSWRMTEPLRRIVTRRRAR